ncbi:hypothetical protein GCM10007989_20420 [Devosia pacifica]|uniref:N-acetyltransferase domain-containing protein n=1 Tax=Devosia pacifica TaxID=1335967 RepID=A0A918S5C6_9HYPH|nr:GNAT family N-acetyltransferase [Devosia pacifica]GHA24674.1 hypothetical protein GCM10007989_20420 [Devosia pacifica]
MATIRETLAPSAGEIDVLRQIIRTANSAVRSEPDGYQPVGFMLPDAETGETIGGLNGHAGYDWLFVQYLAVPPELRGQGVGSALLQRAEQWARERGLIGIWLDTFAFGAPDFYRRHGFSEFATIEGFPKGSRRHYFLKRLNTVASP